MTSNPLVYIPKGSTASIIAYLVQKNFDLVAKIDIQLLKMIGQPQAGWVNIDSTQLSRGDFLYKLSHSKAALQTISLIPGETKEVFFTTLASTLNLSYDKLIQYYNEATPYADGFLVPETYHVPIGIDEQELIEVIGSFSKKYHKESYEKLFGDFDEEKWYKFIVIGSIIQKEAARVDEMPVVSSVIYNRLKKEMKLQMDGTLNYGKYSHINVTAQRIREDTSSYNTYLNKGLPPYAIGSVSKEAFMAAIYPKQTNYLYFVKNKNGTHDFTENYETHLQNINHQ